MKLSKVFTPLVISAILSSGCAKEGVDFDYVTPTGDGKVVSKLFFRSDSGGNPFDYTEQEKYFLFPARDKNGKDVTCNIQVFSSDTARDITDRMRAAAVSQGGKRGLAVPKDACKPNQ